MEKVVIIGGGPAGSFTAYNLAKDYEVELYEEDSSVGKPVRCTGIVTSEIKQLLKLKKSYILNKITKAKIFAPNSRYVELNFKRPNYILDRELFDKSLAGKASEKGVRIHTNTKFVAMKGKLNPPYYILLKKNKKILREKADYLIGADGPLSTVAAKTGFPGKKQFWVGIQHTIRLENSNTVEFYPYIGTYSWVVPVDEHTVRIGTVAETNVSYYFKKFLKFRIGNNYKKISVEGGLIPRFSLFRKTQKNRIYLVGDAAGQVKALTGGGIVPGLIAAKILANSIKEHKNYDLAWKRTLGKELLINNFMRYMLDNFSYRDWNSLIDDLNTYKIKKVLNAENRDFPSRYLLKMLMANPGLIRFITKII